MSKCETVVVTPSQAKVLRETANFELQRPINKHNVARLRLEMEAGRFIPGTPIYFAVMPDKSLLALNGNHTLTAAAEMEGTVELTFIYEPVQTLKEAAQIYSRFDLHRIRSWRDTLRAYSAEEMLSGSTQWTSAFAAAMGAIIEGFTSARGLGRYGAGHGKNFVDDRLIFGIMAQSPMNRASEPQTKGCAALDRFDLPPCGKVGSDYGKIHYCLHLDCRRNRSHRRRLEKCANAGGARA